MSLPQLPPLLSSLHLNRLEELESSLMEEFLYSMHHFLSSSSSLMDSSSPSSSYRLRSLSLCLRRPCPSSNPSLPSLLPLLFPRLEELAFHSLHPSLLPHLTDLSHLPHLTSLLIGGVPLNNLRPLLLQIGARLLLHIIIIFTTIIITINRCTSPPTLLALLRLNHRQDRPLPHRSRSAKPHPSLT